VTEHYETWLDLASSGQFGPVRRPGFVSFTHHTAHGRDGGSPHRPRFPRLPVRQWVLSVPKRLRYLMQRDAYRQATLLELVYYLIFYYLTNLVI
jgi:hypothetical protein